MILYDPITKKTALAHVDKFTDTKSLAGVIANFPPGTKLEARLVGGRDRSQQSKAVSDDNINRVLSELKNHSTVNIKSADIGDKGALICQQFSGQKITQFFVNFRIPLEINNHY